MNNSSLSDDATLKRFVDSLASLWGSLLENNINQASTSALSDSALLHGDKAPLRLTLLGCPEYLRSLYLRDPGFANKHLWSDDDKQNYMRYLEEREQKSYKHIKQLEHKLYLEKKKHSRKPRRTERKAPAISLLGALYQIPSAKREPGRKRKDYSEIDAILKAAKKYQSENNKRLKSGEHMTKSEAIMRMAQQFGKTRQEIKALTNRTTLNRWSKIPTG